MVLATFSLLACELKFSRKMFYYKRQTRSGKTGIAADPHLLPSMKGKVTLVVSPLLVLEEEQVRSVKS